MGCAARHSSLGYCSVEYWVLDIGRGCAAGEQTFLQRIDNRRVQSQRRSRKAEASSIASRKAWRTREQSDQSVNFGAQAGEQTFLQRKSRNTRKGKED